ncbi:MAG: hypothetical protein OSJ54_12070 [Oscillospiraceae bacterium]|nr:hypothetical protein [Oscillospiraceae bacterium]
MNDLNELNKMVEKLLLSGKTFGETIEAMKNRGYSHEQVWNAIGVFDKKYRKQQSPTIYDGN